MNSAAQIAEMRQEMEKLERMVTLEAERNTQLEVEFKEKLDEAVRAKLNEAMKERLKDVNEVVEKAVRAKLAGALELELDGLLQGKLVMGVAAQLKKDLEIEQKTRYDVMQEGIVSLKTIVGRLRDETVPHLFRMIDVLLDRTRGNVTKDEHLHPGLPSVESEAYTTDADDLNSLWYDVE
jgi:hypothetical protein